MRKVCELGRSMVEMLGVLAIIGVLSVGGIAGYSKAMRKHKMNKTIEQITTIIANISSFYAGRETFDGLDESTVKAAQLAPSEMFFEKVHPMQQGYMKNMFGGGVYITGYDNSKAVMIEFGDIPLDICTYLFSYDWSAYSNVRGISYGISGASISKDCVNGTTGRGGIDIYACSLPVSASKAAEYCNHMHRAEDGSAFAQAFGIAIEK